MRCCISNGSAEIARHKEIERELLVMATTCWLAANGWREEQPTREELAPFIPSAAALVAADANSVLRKQEGQQ